MKPLITIICSYFVICSNVLFAQAPLISYGSPKSYPAGTAISVLVPVNIGGAVPPAIYGQVSTFAGSGVIGSANGTGASASFHYPNNVATDATGNIYVADTYNNSIRRITPGGLVSTLAGGGAASSTNGTGTGAGFNNPRGVALDAAGNVYVADYSNNLIRKVSPLGVVTTFAGSGIQGSSNGTGTAASFNLPWGIATDAAGNIYVADLGNSLIRKITPLGVVSTIAGSGAPGSANGTGTAASFNKPQGVSVDIAGNIYVADTQNQLIRKITSVGVVTTLAGSGLQGTTNGTGIAASFSTPQAVTVDVIGNVYVSEYNEIRKISPAGVVVSIAGATSASSANGTGTAAGFNSPAGLTLDGIGNLYIADFYNNEIRKISLTGYTLKTALPAGLAFDGTTGIISGTPNIPTPAQNYTVTAYNRLGSSVAIVNIGIIPALVVQVPLISYTNPQAFTEGTTISPVAPTNSGGAIPAVSQLAVSTFAGSGVSGSSDGTGTMASFNMGQGAATINPRTGVIYLADQGNNLVRQITSGQGVSTLAGNGTPGSVNATGTSASFNHPTGIAVDRLGNIYVSDSNNNLIRKITPAGVVTTFSGSGAQGSADGTGAAASFNNPTGITIDNNSHLYVLDSNNGKLRMINTITGLVSTVALNNSIGSARYITYDQRTGNLYLSGPDNYIRVIAGTAVSILAGNGSPGVVNGSLAVATFNNPSGISVDLSGDIFVADQGNNQIRAISAAGVVTTYAGNGIKGLVNTIPAASSFNGPTNFISWAGYIFITDAGDNIIRKIGYTGYGLTPRLPAGLNMDQNGVISGTPTAVLGTTNYLITAYNSGGTGTANLTITVNNAIPASKSANIFTIAGNGLLGNSGDGGLANAASINHPYAMARDKAGNLYIATNDNFIRKVDALTQKITTIAGTGVAGYSGDGGPAVSAQLNNFQGLTGLAVDVSGNLYIGDYNNNRVRKIDGLTHIISTIAGTGVAGNSGDSGAATAALLNGPGGILIDANNNIYIADENNAQIRKVDAMTHNISTVVSGLGFVERMTFDKNGNLYFGDESFFTISKIDAVTHTVSVIAGNGSPGYSGDGGLALAATFKGPMGIAIDASGNIYVVDQPSNVVRKIDAVTQIISTFAGIGSAVYSGDGAPAIKAGLNFATDLLIDNSGYFYIDDYVNNVIRRIGGAAPSGSAPYISYAGPQTYTAGFPIAALTPVNIGGAIPATPYGLTSTIAGKVGVQGSGNGTGTTASFNQPKGITVDASGNLYIGDTQNNLIRKITQGGVVSTFAGSGLPGVANGTGIAATFNAPTGVVVDGIGNIYVADQNNSLIRKITPAGVVTTVAGHGIGSADGNGTAASFNQPQGIAVDGAGNLYIADTNNSLIRKISSAGLVTTLAGNGNSGFANGVGTAASFSNPTGLSLDVAGNVYVVDAGNNLIRKITPGGVVNTFAGGGNNASISVNFGYPNGIAVDASGNLFVTDQGKNQIIQITQSGLVFTTSGGGKDNKGADGIGSIASFNQPSGITISSSGNLYVADNGDNEIRKIITTGYSINSLLPTGLSFNNSTGLITGTPVDAFPMTNYTVAAFNTKGVSMTGITILVQQAAAPKIAYQGPQTYLLNSAITPLIPSNTGGQVQGNLYGETFTIAGGNNGNNGSVVNGTTTDAAGNIYITDKNRLIKITPAGVTNKIAGNNNGTAGSSNGLGTAASFNNPIAIATDPAGNIYVADQGNNLVRKVSSAGLVTTLAGSGAKGTQNGAAIAASFSLLNGIAVDGIGNVYVSDAALIRKISVGGNVSTFAGGGAGTTIDGTATAASFNQPWGITIDITGNLFIADHGNSLIRMITPLAVVTTIAGGGNGIGTNGSGKNATFNGPAGIAVDAAGNLYIADTNNNLIRQINPSGLVTTFAGGTAPGFVDGIAVTSRFSGPTGLSLDKFGNLYVGDSGNSALRKLIATNYFTLNPVLPTGLSFDTKTGDISGTPTVISPSLNYTVTAYNGGGSSAAPLNIAVNAFKGFAAIPSKSYGTTDFDPGAISVAPITYTSSNTAVAVIVAGKIHIKGIGTSLITAISAGSSLQQTLTVTTAPLSITANNQSRTLGTANSPLTLTYNGFVNGDTQLSLTQQPTESTIATAASPIGSYPITVSGAVDANYNISYFNGLLTVTGPIAPHNLTTNDNNYQTLAPSNTDFAALPIVRPSLSPNGDGMNDVLFIDGITNYPQNKLTIVDRAGQKIFEMSGYDNVDKVFDGHSSINGRLQRPGTYFYVLDYKVGDHTKYITGFIILKY